MIVGKPVDMWSFGVILYILLGGYPPFYDDNQKHLFRKIIRADYEFHPDRWGYVSEEAKDLIRGLLTLNPHDRLTVEQALSHPWLKKADAELAAKDLNENLKELTKFQATRVFKRAANKIILINRLKGASPSGVFDASAVNTDEKKAEKPQERIFSMMLDATEILKDMPESMQFKKQLTAKVSHTSSAETKAPADLKTLPATPETVTT